MDRKILITLTDFSPASENAALYAARLARHVGGELLLLHVYQLPVTMNDMPVLVVTAEELKSNVDISLGHSREQLLREVPGLEVRTESRLGDVNDQVSELSKEVEPFAVVMGTHHYSGLERALFGRTPVSVVRHSHCPVITVPESFGGVHFKRVVLATDLVPVTMEMAARVRHIVEVLWAELHVVHVAVERREVDPAPFLEPFRSLNPHYHNVYSENVTEGLRVFLQQEEIELVVALPHRHSLMELLFFKGHTMDLLEGLDRPVVFIRE